MNPKDLLFLIEKYAKKFKEMGVENIEHPHDGNPITPQVGLCHCHNMLDHLEKMVQDFIKDGNTAKWEKALRWLGFIQGVLWSAGVYTITELRSHNCGQNEEAKE